MKHLLLLISLLTSFSVLAETAVIVHPSNTSNFSDDDIQSIFLGKLESFPNGKEAVPIILPEADDFIKAALGKSKRQYKAYWAKMVFTGKGAPPKKVSASEMIKLISDNPNLIGILDASQVPASVKVVKKF